MNNRKCLNCTDRYVGCHAICDSYLKYKEQNDKIRQQILLNSLIDFRNRRVAKYGK